MPPPHAPRETAPPKPLVLLLAVASVLFALVIGGCEHDGPAHPQPRTPAPARSHTPSPRAQHSTPSPTGANVARPQRCCGHARCAGAGSPDTPDGGHRRVCSRTRITGEHEVPLTDVAR